MGVPGSRCIGGAGRYPTICAGVVSPAGIQIPRGAIKSTPDDHFTSGPDCRVPRSGKRSVCRAGGCPAIRGWIISAASVQLILVFVTAPDDHFTASPHCCVSFSAIRRISRAGSCPAIRTRIVSRTRVQLVATPYDHFTAGPHCRVTRSGIGRVGDASGCPCIIDAVIGDEDFRQLVGGMVQIRGHIILSEVEGSRGITSGQRRGIPRLRSE